jgi:uncharacterized membrane protein
VNAGNRFGTNTDGAEGGSDPIGKGRVEAFSDGVIAVAITLLVLDLRVPEPGDGISLGHGLAALWPNFAAYVISFVVIGIMWINHHAMLRRLAGVDRSILVLNLILLLCIVLLPFSTSVLANYLGDSGDGRLAAVVYAGSLLVTSSVFVALQFHILMRRSELLREPLPADVKRNILARSMFAPPAYLMAGLLGLLWPYLTLAVCAVMGAFYLLTPALTRRARVA